MVVGEPRLLKIGALEIMPKILTSGHKKALNNASICAEVSVNIVSENQLTIFGILVNVSRRKSTIVVNIQGPANSNVINMPTSFGTKESVCSLIWVAA
jgi:hypothetical protein